MKKTGPSRLGALGLCFLPDIQHQPFNFRFRINAMTNVEKCEVRAGADGNVSAREQQRVQHAENRQSKRVYRQKHDGQKR